MGDFLFFLLYFVLAILACICLVNAKHITDNTLSRIPEFVGWICLAFVGLMAIDGLFRWPTHDHTHGFAYFLLVIGVAIVCFGLYRAFRHEH